MSSWHFNQLRFVFGMGFFMSFYGLVSMIVWFAGKFLGWQVTSRVVVIFLILLTLPLALVANSFRKKGKKKKDKKKEEAKKAGEEEVAGDGAAEKTAKPAGVDKDLSKGADEVVAFLKGSNLGTGGNAVYSLPWYLVAGVGGSGKSALVLASGLNFQNLPSQRHSEQKYIRPTRQVDWRVTSDAVFVDTAGRFQAESADQNQWSSLLETIKKHRANRPLDGMILAVNTEKILHSDERDIEEMAKLLRSRLDDATKRLKCRFPVYLVFTNADAIEGFRESFSRSKKEGENLVWGSTIPLEKSDNAQSLFDAEFELLQDSLMQRRLIRLSAPFSPTKQLRIFNFPLHFASTRRKLGTFVTNLFRPNPFSESPFLRGFYFTAVPKNRARRKAGKPAAPQTVGDSYFTRKFFRDVVLRDKDLVKTFREQRQKPPILGWFLTAIGTFLIVALLAFSVYSLYRNKALLGDAVSKGSVVLVSAKADIDVDPLKKTAEDAQKEINELDDLRKILEDLDDYERNGPPIYMRFGLYSGSRLLKDRLLNIYYVGVERRFRQPTIRRLERELRMFARGRTTTGNSNSGAPSKADAQEEILDRNYDLLEAYLLLSEKHKDKARDRTAPSKIADTLEQYWIEESKLPPGNEPLAKEQLLFYFKQIDRESGYQGDTGGFPRITPDESLVKNVRVRLTKYPAYKRYLKRQTREVTNELGEVSVETLLGGNSLGLFEGTHKVPGAYTAVGYRNFMKARIEKADEVLSEDDWVMGEEGKVAEIKSDELAKLKTDYFNKYAGHWQRFVAETKIVQYKTDEDMKEALRAFSGPESPMKVYLREVIKNTNLSAKPAPKSWFDFSWISDAFSSSGGTGEAESNTEVEKQFNQVILFVGDQQAKKPQPVDKYAEDLAVIANRLGPASDTRLRDYKQQLVNEDDSARSFHTLLTRVEQAVDGKLKAFQTSSAQKVAQLLKMPLLNVRVKFGVDATRLIEKTWKESVYKEAKSIETGYPFIGNRTPVTDLKSLTTFLNPRNGTLTTFYNTRLKNFFDGTPGDRLTVKADSDKKFSKQFVDYLNNAFRLQKALFGGNPTPKFEYDFIIIKDSSMIVEGTVDGTPVSNRETGSFKLTFPAQSGINGVSLNLISTSATTSASGTDSASGSSDANLNYPGEWGLFNFFDAASGKTKSANGYRLTYNRGGKTVRLQIRTIGGDLFDRSIFTSVRAPENALR